MKWDFPRLLKNQVESGITQRDQFDNDEVRLSETIVREAIQNSLDAAIDDNQLVRVRFSFLEESNGLKRKFMKQLLTGLRPHAHASGADLTAFDSLKPSALVIEDFGTRGLTGSVTEKDEDNFSDFWRRHGKSHKSGKSRGRWGLGKLVYSYTSQVDAFFAITKRNHDDNFHLMGQAVLKLHKVDGVDYSPHGFFCDLENEGNLLEEFQVPIREQTFIDEFIEHFSLERGTDSGLSVIIPYPSNLDGKRMIGIVIQNYFYPLITKKLEVKIDDTLINSTNIRELARVYANEHFSEIDTLFDFIEEASSEDPASLVMMSESWTADQKLGLDDFEPKVLDELRKRFSAGELVSLQMPISLTKKDSTVINTNFSIFIKRPDGLQKGLDLYVRGGLTLPSEAKFRERKALGVLVAEEEPICSFLGDAENAAHTLWTSHTEKLKESYKSSQRAVTMIKKALVQLYDLLAEVTEEKDEHALDKFFWFQKPGKPKKKKMPIKPTPPKPVINVRRQPKFSVNQVKGGLIIQKGNGLLDEELPRKVSAKFAYEISRGDAFKNWSPYDFDTAKDIKISTAGGVNIDSAGGQEMTFTVTSPQFYIEIGGFDTNRDLKIRVR